MPYAPARPCADQPCPELVIRGSRCPRHDRQHRPNANQRGYTYRWQQLVARAIDAQPWCSACGATEDLTGDHIHPRSKGGQATIENVRVLCRSCNSRKGNR
jgi:5-methylcytosine-specific restriction protein A